jgi:hypothetical protein
VEEVVVEVVAQGGAIAMQPLLLLGSTRSAISPSELKKLSTHDRTGGSDIEFDVDVVVDEKTGEDSVDDDDDEEAEGKCGEMDGSTRNEDDEDDASVGTR